MPAPLTPPDPLTPPAPTGAFSGSRVLVTGGTRGIGHAIVAMFLDRGAQVVFCGRTPTREGAELEARGGATYRPADLTDPGAVPRLVAEAVAVLGGLDVVVHCAAIAPEHPVDTHPLAAWDTTLTVNLTAAMLLVREAATELRRSPAGRVVMVSSITGPRTALPRLTAYAASKAGLEGFVRAAAVELAPTGITVNAVAPGTVLTAALTRLLGEDGVDLARRKVPVGRLGAPDDIADAVLFLASPASSFITGQSLVVDGGQTLVELF